MSYVTSSTTIDTEEIKSLLCKTIWGTKDPAPADKVDEAYKRFVELSGVPVTEEELWLQKAFIEEVVPYINPADTDNRMSVMLDAGKAFRAMLRNYRFHIEHCTGAAAGQNCQSMAREEAPEGYQEQTADTIVKITELPTEDDMELLRAYDLGYMKPRNSQTWPAKLAAFIRTHCTGSEKLPEHLNAPKG